MHKLLIASLLFGLASGTAIAQGPQVRQHLNGYTCMSINLSEQQLMDFNALPPVYAAPSAGAARIGVGTATMIVKIPPEVVNGFEAVLHLNGQPGWIRADMLRPWVNASDPRTRCIPAVMSNGRPGFDYIRPRR